MRRMGFIYCLIYRIAVPESGSVIWISFSERISNSFTQAYSFLSIPYCSRLFVTIRVNKPFPYRSISYVTELAPSFMVMLPLAMAILVCAPEASSDTKDPFNPPSQDSFFSCCWESGFSKKHINHCLLNGIINPIFR